MSNTLIKLLEAFPNLGWYWDEVSANPNISLEYIKSHPEHPWVILADNSNESVLTNPNLTIDYVYELLEKSTLSNTCWRAISRNPGIKLGDIENNPDLPWQWGIIGFNPNITLEFILKYIDKLKDNTQYLGATKNITLQNIKDYPELFWDLETLSCNPNLTFDFVLNHNQIKGDTSRWLYSAIFRKPGVTIQDIFNNKNLLKHEYIKNGVLLNPNLTEDIILSDEFQQFLNSLNYTWDIIDYLNPAITLETIEKFKETYKSSVIYLNPNITFEWFSANPISFDNVFEQISAINNLSKNKFLCHPFFEDAITIRV